MPRFEVVAPFSPTGDQPQAIAELTEGVKRGDRYQTLLGATGSGKTFTISHVIAHAGKPTLVISHNKTLAAQLYGEFRSFFPKNAVGYFISYYDYYQPEAYVPQTNTYIEKDASINDDIDRLRLAATSMLLERDDVIIVASVSCIYGLGSPEDFKTLVVPLSVGAATGRDALLERLVAIQYTRTNMDLERGMFRVRGDVLEILPAYDERAVRIEMWGDTIDRISLVDPVTGRVVQPLERTVIYPAKHFVTTEAKIDRALRDIRAELEERVAYFEQGGKLLEAQRLRQRTEYDIEMLRVLGYCPGIENYSRHLSGRKPGERPFCLIDYFPKDFLCIIDESHVTVPQIGGMYEGDRSRKQTLVDYGFRLPSALDNRPARFDEFEAMTPQTIYVSATPTDFEISRSQGVIVEQVIRPTGLVDPEVIIHPIEGQIDDLLGRIRERVARRERTLVTTLTKRMSEDLTEYLHSMDVRVRYLHSDIDAIERVEILRGLRLGQFDVLVGVNLLREGLDLPEVSLVAVLDADKEGFLRSERSLIQTAGRAARNVAGEVVLYADNMTGSMRRAIDEMNRRRTKQLAYNAEHGITPRTIVKSVDQVMLTTSVADAAPPGETDPELLPSHLAELTPQEAVGALEKEMLAAARRLEFERAASLRDRIEELLAGVAAGASDEAAGTAAAALRRAAARRIGRRNTGVPASGGEDAARYLYPPAAGVHVSRTGETAAGVAPAGHAESPPPRRHPKRTVRRLPRRER
jgi:excinuclease ABC subunit B